MKFLNYRPTKTLWLVLLLSLLLAILATLQYRWLGQVSNGERQRMQASLDAGTKQFSQDFNREITRAYLSFQIDASMLRDENSLEVKERLEQWSAKAPYPKLISELYLLDKDKSNVARFKHFNSSTGLFEQTDWPNEFDGLHSRLVTQGNDPDVHGQDVLERLLLDPVEPNVPALVAPILVTPRVLLSEKKDIQTVTTKETTDTKGESPLAGYLIIKLNREVISNELIPALAKRYFSAGNGLEYNLSVLDLKNQPVYRSTTTPPSPKTTGVDARASLLDIQPEQLDALWFGLPRKNVIADEKNTGPDEKPRHEKIVMRSDKQSSNGTSNSRSVTVRVINRETQQADAAGKDAVGGPWQLLIQHSAGSLDAAVTSTRRRNLAISFGILLLLAGSMTMIVVSTRRAERLANRQMNFVSAVSHEFRTPLSVICSAGENLADGVISSSQQTKKYGELIRNEGRRLTEMVEQILEFAGARSRQKGLQLRPTEIGLVIKDALAAYQPVIEEKGYTVEQTIESGLPLVAADSAALGRSLQNLLSNAIKYESNQRWIGIRAQSGLNNNVGEIQISVEDQGRGIAAADVQHIFEPFYRGREVVDAQIHGNGLGLSLVKQVIEAHHGTITVDSVEGKGSTFTLHLPVINANSKENGASAADNV